MTRRILTSSIAVGLFAAALALTPTSTADPLNPPCGSDNPKYLKQWGEGPNKVEFWGSDSGTVEMYYVISAVTLNNGADGYGFHFLATAPSDGPGYQRASGTTGDNVGCFPLGAMGYPEDTPVLHVSIHAGAWGKALTQQQSCSVSAWVEYSVTGEVNGGITTSGAALGGSVSTTATYGGEVSCEEGELSDYDSELLLRTSVDVENPYMRPAPPPPGGASPTACDRWEAHPLSLQDFMNCQYSKISS